MTKITGKIVAAMTVLVLAGCSTVGQQGGIVPDFGDGEFYPDKVLQEIVRMLPDEAKEKLAEQAEARYGVPENVTMKAFDLIEQHGVVGLVQAGLNDDLLRRMVEDAIRKYRDDLDGLGADPVAPSTPLTTPHFSSPGSAPPSIVIRIGPATVDIEGASWTETVNKAGTTTVAE